MVDLTIVLFFIPSSFQDEEKEVMLNKIRSQYEDWMGMAMTFSIVNHVLDNLEEFRDVIKNENVVEREEKVSEARRGCYFGVFISFL